jgi:golgi to ER traffic protein 4
VSDILQDVGKNRKDHSTTEREVHSPAQKSSCSPDTNLRLRIAEGNFYEAHQQLRVITSRYLKSSDYASASDVLYNGALLLLNAGQGGSGGDLANTLINDVYIKGELPVTEENKKKSLEVFQAFPENEPTRKKFVTEMIGWSTKFGDSERGDPEIQHVVGRKFAEGAAPPSPDQFLY